MFLRAGESSMSRGLCWGTALFALAAALMVPGAALADRPVAHAFQTTNDTYSVGPAVRDGSLPVDTRAATNGPLPSLRALKALAAGAAPPIGTQKTFLILDDFFGTY